MSAAENCHKKRGVWGVEQAYFYLTIFLVIHAYFMLFLFYIKET